jgi:hypothetical protein
VALHAVRKRRGSICNPLYHFPIPHLTLLPITPLKENEMAPDDFARVSPTPDLPFVTGYVGVVSIDGVLGWI